MIPLFLYNILINFKKFWMGSRFQKICNHMFLSYFCTPFLKIDSVAQLVEHNTFNVGALGSSPSGITSLGRIHYRSGFQQMLRSAFLLKHHLIRCF